MLFYHRWLDMGKSSKILTSRRSHSKQSNRLNTSVKISIYKKTNKVEADCFWCLGWLLDGIQDNYTFAQPGIQRNVAQLDDLIKRIQTDLHEHLLEQGVQFLQFSFRWFNNLLMREVFIK